MDWKKAYLNLFNQFTDIQIKLNEIEDILKKAQIESENITIESQCLRIYNPFEPPEK